MKDKIKCSISISLSQQAITESRARVFQNKKVVLELINFVLKLVFCRSLNNQMSKYPHGPKIYKQ